MFDRRIRAALTSLGQRSGKIAKATAVLTETTETSLDHALSGSKDAQAAAERIDLIAENVTAIAAAAEEFSITMQEIQRNVKDSDQSVASVSEATAHLAEGATRIAINTDHAQSVTQQAVTAVSEARELVTGLESAALEIGKLTAVIHDISEQTKMLALNATIEAARAGEAGKGFVVVARDVKELAAETRDASDVISSQVAGIESSIENTVSAIGKVANVISEVQKAVSTIAGETEQQSAAAQGIAANSTDAASNFEAITKAIDEGTTATMDVTRRLAESSTQASQAKEDSHHLAHASEQIAREATLSFASTLEIAAEQDEIMSRLHDMHIAENDDNETDLGLFTFSSRFSVLVDDMDDDHKRIIDYINEIHAQIKTDQARPKIAKTFVSMADFTREHFAREEEIMERYHYPDIVEHKAIHHDLLAKLADYANALEQDASDINLVGILNFLNKWLRGHILHVDRKYGEYYRSKRINAEARHVAGGTRQSA